MKFAMKIEEILYQMKVFPPAGTAVAEDGMRIIAKVISKLPEKIQKKVLSDLWFICLDGVYGQYERLFIPMPQIEGKDGVDMSIVFLNLDSMKRKSEKTKITVIAHE